MLNSEDPLSAARGMKINSFDPPLPVVGTACPTPPFPPFSHPPIKLASLHRLAVST